MRVSDNLRYETFKKNTGILKGKIDKNQEMVASQKKILTPSDGPVAMSKAIQLDSQKSVNDQYTRNLTTLGLYGGMYEGSLNAIQDSLTRAKELAVSMSSDNMTAQGRKVAAEEVGKIIDQLVSIGNSKVGNTYIFGGKKTNIVPFTLDTNPASPTYYSVTYNGTADVPDVFISKGQTEKAGVSGQRIFDPGGSSDIFAILRGLKIALEDNIKPVIGEAITNLDEAINLTTGNISYVGVYRGSIDAMTTTLQSNTDALTEVISDLTDADMTALISEYTLLTNAYEASLACMSKLQQMNVLNYLH
jgi:flagellar hook-associated protein 3 FlgL